MSKTIVRRVKVATDHLPDNLPEIIKQIYASRGMESAQELELNVAHLQGMVDETALMGMDKACQLLHDALVNKLRIVIVGDFDADGATSTALMMTALSLFNSNNHDFIVPNRFEYGYGLTPEIVDIAAQQNTQMLITVDNGISCIAGVKRAKDLGMQVIVTDHHLPGHSLPIADAIVNPNQHGCNFPSKALAGVGVAFYLMLALRKYCREQNYFSEQGIAEPNIAQLLDLVALGTVADVVSLDANNRILVEQGLKRIRAGKTRPGIQALIEIANKNQQRLVASDFGFALGPRINAAGRLDDMSYGINCLLATDLSSARVMAAELDDLNKTRREIEQGMQAEAEQVLTSLKFDEDNLPNAIALYQQDWHQGVIGIVAGRLKEKFHRPCIVFANGKDDDSVDVSEREIKGSARSIPGLHIRDLLEHIDSQHPDIILKFGGHAMAAGLSIKHGNFARFQQLFNELAGKWLKEEDLQSIILSDGELMLEHLSLDFAEKLRDAGPWGQNFPEPLFDDTFKLVQQRIVGEKHLKIVVEKQGEIFDGIAFNVDVKTWPNAQVKQVHLAYRLDVNEFRGKRTVQFMVENITAI
ncbi:MULTISPECIES: single-stranded-DNA-specific exonuclease RecJ [Colwellia]|uniref:Single-stranded-DNA-specific exonuclease RecJ n=1 Tax=Colwellia psychrerythraea (strain 34H / ATCC BAA-681) TaxID=167879 RepID=Q47WS3_COLP3|nr:MULTISPECIES: single-stranded-DNA-specific exonuclease RecJ [Colwellia]AAZ27994.1 single-stranded-DNA-specific exonuclease RecJ [Colwellia psychrerythraea 34H]PKH85241.1 single-stranded-DNA-specific exonuclease RecJ [Colwellia sp. Bg11-28]